MSYRYDMNKYNLVNEKNRVEPNYDLNELETAIQIYIDLRGNLIILGVVDNNYIHWASLTKTDDKELNEKIFNHIAGNTFDMVSHQYKALEAANISYDDLGKWYSSRLVREDRHNMAWKTPFGHYYGAEQIQNNGRFFADDVSIYLESLQSLCRFRETDGNYAGILSFYYDKLLEDEGDYRYYEIVKPLIEILEKEDYLRLSENNEIREWYLKCMDRSSQLYNRYMTAVR